MIILVRPPCDVELSVCIGVFGCGCPSSISVVRMGTANFASMNNVPDFASAAELIPTFIINEMFRTALLFSEMSSLLGMEKCPPLGVVSWSWRGIMHHC